MFDKKVQNAVLIVTVLTAFLISFAGSCMNMSVPNIESDFQVNAALVGWVITAYIITTAALSVPFGKIADVKGRRKVLVVGICGYTITAVLVALSPTFAAMILFRVLQGVFASMLFATNNAILITVFPPEKRGQMLGISIAFTYIGLSVGPVLGGILNHYIGWRSIFIITAIMAAIAFVLAVRKVPNIAVDEHHKKPDVLGNVLFIAAISISLYGLSNLNALSFGWLILVVGLLLGVAFVMVELKAEDPMMRISMFTKCKAFTFSNFAALLNYASTFAISYFMSIYLQVVKGFDSQVAGLIMVCMPLMQAIFTPYMGKLSDRIAPSKLASAGMGICVVSLILFANLSVDSPLILVILALLIAGFGYGVFSSPNNNAILSLVSKEEYSIANSILSTMRTVGQSMSMAIVTIIVGMTLGNVSLEKSTPEALVNTMHMMFVLCVIMCIGGLILSLQRRKG